MMIMLIVGIGTLMKLRGLMVMKKKKWMTKADDMIETAGNMTTNVGECAEQSSIFAHNLTLTLTLWRWLRVDSVAAVD
jgi:hypothetical protein